MFSYIRDLFKRYDRTVYIRFSRAKVTFEHYPIGVRYQDEPILACRKKGEAFVVTAVGRAVYDLKPDDTSVVYEPFKPFALDPENFELAEEVVREMMQRQIPFMYRLFSPKAVIHPDKSYISDMEREAYRELALSAGAREAVVHVGERLTENEVEDLIRKGNDAANASS